MAQTYYQSRSNNGMNKKEHKKRHIELHKMLDELVADMITHKKGFMPSSATVIELMQWSHEQTINPKE